LARRRRRLLTPAQNRRETWFISIIAVAALVMVLAAVSAYVWR